MRPTTTRRSHRRSTHHCCGALEYQIAHRPQSASASRFTAEHAGFFILSQSGEQPDASEQGVQHAEQRSEANQSAEYGDN
jgi:hypothetical protein